MRRLLVVCAIAMMVTGCITGHVITESQHSLADIRADILYIMGPPREAAENQREFLSAYFSRNKDPHFDPNKAEERLYAKFTILGDRRPYDIQVQVFIEQKEDGEYEDEGLDDDLSDQLAHELKVRLNRSREERNLIDDMRVF